MFIPDTFFLQIYSTFPRETHQSTRLSDIPITTKESSSSSNGSFSSQSFSPISTTSHPTDSISSRNRNDSPVFFASPLSSPKIRTEASSPLPQTDSYSYNQRSPMPSPHSPRRSTSPNYNRSPRGSVSYMDRSPSPSPTGLDRPSRSATLQTSSNLLSPYDNNPIGRRSPRPDRSPSPLSFNLSGSSTLPRNFGGFKHPGKWLSASSCKAVRWKLWSANKYDERTIFLVQFEPRTTPVMFTHHEPSSHD